MTVIQTIDICGNFMQPKTNNNTQGWIWLHNNRFDLQNSITHNGYANQRKNGETFGSGSNGGPYCMTINWQGGDKGNHWPKGFFRTIDEFIPDRIYRLEYNSFTPDGNVGDYGQSKFIRVELDVDIIHRANVIRPSNTTDPNVFWTRYVVFFKAKRTTSTLNFVYEGNNKKHDGRVYWDAITLEAHDTDQGGGGGGSTESIPPSVLNVNQVQNIDTLNIGTLASEANNTITFDTEEGGYEFNFIQLQDRKNGKWRIGEIQIWVGGENILLGSYTSFNTSSTEWTNPRTTSIGGGTSNLELIPRITNGSFYTSSWGGGFNADGDNNDKDSNIFITLDRVYKFSEIEAIFIHHTNNDDLDKKFIKFQKRTAPVWVFVDDLDEWDTRTLIYNSNYVQYGANGGLYNGTKWFLSSNLHSTYNNGHPYAVNTGVDVYSGGSWGGYFNINGDMGPGINSSGYNKGHGIYKYKFGSQTTTTTTQRNNATETTTKILDDSQCEYVYNIPLNNGTTSTVTNSSVFEMGNNITQYTLSSFTSKIFSDLPISADLVTTADDSSDIVPYIKFNADTTLTSLPPAIFDISATTLTFSEGDKLYFKFIEFPKDTTITSSGDITTTLNLTAGHYYVQDLADTIRTQFNTRISIKWSGDGYIFLDSPSITLSITNNDGTTNEVFTSNSITLDSDNSILDFKQGTFLEVEYPNRTITQYIPIPSQDFVNWNGNTPVGWTVIDGGHGLFNFTDTNYQNLTFLLPGTSLGATHNYQPIVTTNVQGMTIQKVYSLEYFVSNPNNNNNNGNGFWYITLGTDVIDEGPSGGLAHQTLGIWTFKETNFTAKTQDAQFTIHFISSSMRLVIDRFRIYSYEEVQNPGSENVVSDISSIDIYEDFTIVSNKPTPGISFNAIYFTQTQTGNQRKRIQVRQIQLWINGKNILANATDHSIYDKNKCSFYTQDGQAGQNMHRLSDNSLSTGIAPDGDTDIDEFWIFLDREYTWNEVECMVIYDGYDGSYGRAVTYYYRLQRHTIGQTPPDNIEWQSGIYNFPRLKQDLTSIVISTRGYGSSDAHWQTATIYKIKFGAPQTTQTTTNPETDFATHIPDDSYSANTTSYSTPVGNHLIGVIVWQLTSDSDDYNNLLSVVFNRSEKLSYSIQEMLDKMSLDLGRHQIAVVQVSDDSGELRVYFHFTYGVTLNNVPRFIFKINRDPNDRQVILNDDEQLSFRYLMLSYGLSFNFTGDINGSFNESIGDYFIHDFVREMSNAVSSNITYDGDYLVFHDVINPTTVQVLDLNGIESIIFRLEQKVLTSEDNKLYFQNYGQPEPEPEPEQQSPTDVNLSSITVLENQSINTVVGLLSSVDTRYTNFKYNISGIDAEHFKIIGNNQLVTNSIFDRETKDSYSINISTSHETRPSDIILSASTIIEKQPINTIIGELSSIDDIGLSHIYSLSGIDSNSFDISDNKLISKEVFILNNKSSYDIIITTTDDSELEFSKSFTITITEKFIRWSDKITLTYENNNEIKLALLEDSTSDRNLISNQPISNNYLTFEPVSGTPNDIDFINYGELIYIKSSIDNKKLNYDETNINNKLAFGTNYNNNNSTNFYIHPNITNSNNSSMHINDGAVISSPSEYPKILIDDIIVISSNNQPEYVIDNGVDIGWYGSYVARVYNNYINMYYGGPGYYNNSNDYPHGFKIRKINNDYLFSLSLSNNSVLENTSVGTVIGSFSCLPSNNNDMTYSLSQYYYTNENGIIDNSSINNLFVINGDQLKVNSNFNYEDINSYDIVVIVNDELNSYSKKFTINIINVNESPDNITLSNNSIIEKSDIGTEIGIFTTSDVDSSVFNYSLGSGGDNDFFQINGTNNSLISDSIFNYEEKSTYNINVFTSDGEYTYEKIMQIDIINDVQTLLSLSNNNVNENILKDTEIATITHTTSQNKNHSYTLFITGSDAWRFDISDNKLISRYDNVFNYEENTSHSIEIFSIEDYSEFPVQDGTFKHINENDTSYQQYTYSINNYTISTSSLEISNPGAGIEGVFCGIEGNNSFWYSEKSSYSGSQTNFGEGNNYHNEYSLSGEYIKIVLPYEIILKGYYWASDSTNAHPDLTRSHGIPARWKIFANVNSNEVIINEYSNGSTWGVHNNTNGYIDLSNNNVTSDTYTFFITHSHGYWNGTDANVNLDSLRLFHMS